AGLDQLQGRPFGLGRLPGGAQAGDAGQQRQRRRAALLARVVHQPLAHELLDRGGTAAAAALAPPGAEQLADHELRVERAAYSQQLARRAEDRKSTRLNSSHVAISYAVFCLKKKTSGDLAGARGLLQLCLEFFGAARVVVL